MDTFWTLAKVVLGLEVIVLFHLLGHFLVARLLGVPIEIRLGFGWGIPGCRFSRGKSIFVLAFFPLGGYAQVPQPKEGEEVPRIWRRLAVALGGVTMNVILAWLCFTLCWSHGKERTAAVISDVDAGSPAWFMGLPTGAVIERVGTVENPVFEDFMTQVMDTSEGDKLAIVYSTAGNANTVRVEVTPRLQRGRPVVGVSPSQSLRLAGRRTLGPKLSRPVFPLTPAEAAAPPFESDDLIIGTTDPDDLGQIKAIPEDPRNPGSGNGDYFEWLRRLRLLAGKEMIVQVKRADGGEAKIRVPPAFHFTLGARMQMGPIAAVRQGSVAQKVGIQANDPRREREGDMIVAVEVMGPDGKLTRWDGGSLDPMRLPDELRQWSRRMVRSGKAGARTVTLTLIQQVNPGGQQLGQVKRQLSWDAAWENQQDHSFVAGSPLSIPELGIAYDVTTTVAEGNPDGSLQPGDEIVAIRARSRAELDRHDWPWAFESLQRMDIKDINVEVIRNNQRITLPLKLIEDKTWPSEERGLILTRDIRLQRADNILEALGLGLAEVGKYVRQMFVNSQALLIGRIEPRYLAGPVTLSRAAVRIADYDLFEFIYFVALISLNFTFINLLPIPILDGGEVLLLFIEKLNGKPLAALVRPLAYAVGLILLSGWLLLGVAMDLAR